MARYVCLLRGVNVSGQRKIKMTELRELCESLGYTDVETYVQSGNVVLGSRKARSELGRTLEKAIGERFGHEGVDVLVWTGEELAKLIEDNPFLARGCDASKLHVTFLAEDFKPAALKAIPAEDFLPDEFAPGSKAIYVHCPNGYGRTKLNNAFFERKLKLPATTRNWRTVTQLCELAGKRRGSMSS